MFLVETGLVGCSVYTNLLKDIAYINLLCACVSSWVKDTSGCTGEAQSADEAEQQKSERSVATLLTGTGPSWELHGPRVARRLRHRTRCAFLHLPCYFGVLQPAHCFPVSSTSGSASLWEAMVNPVL